MLAAIAALAVVVAAAWPSGSKPFSSQPQRSATQVASATTAQEQALLRRSRPKAVEPVAGESAATAGLPAEADTGSGEGTPTGPASSTASSKKYRGGNEDPTGDSAISDALVVDKAGVALPPIESPYEVKKIIEAGNQIARTPYLWGGGHGKWLDKGYDCSGSVSYALANAGLLNAPLASGPLMKWGKPGPGKWITIYSNPGHVFMVVAGVRFDTSGARGSSRWQSAMRGTGGFVARHPPGL